MPGSILPVCRSKFTKFSADVGDPSNFSTPLLYSLCHVSFRRYSLSSLEVVEKNEQKQKFWPPFLGRTDFDFSTQIVKLKLTVPQGKCSRSSWPVAGFTIVDVQRIYFPFTSSRQLHDLSTILKDVVKCHSRLPNELTSTEMSNCPQTDLVPQSRRVAHTAS